MIATRLTLGAISVSNSNHLLAMEASTLAKPVRLLPGRAELSLILGDEVDQAAW
jgi:hypothetical protein